MGYYTHFSLIIRTAITRAEAQEITSMINRICTQSEEKSDWVFELDDYIDYSDDEKVAWAITPFDMDIMKWYDWEDDMKDVAHQYPDIEFRLEGRGEDIDDWWVALFKGDKYQIRECVPPVDKWEE